MTLRIPSPRLAVYLAVCVGLAVHALTLTTFPKHWLDEVHCNEMAAAFFARDWNMNLPPPADPDDASAFREKGPWQVYYLGSLAQEGAYRLFGHAGPRIVGLAAFALLVVLVGRLFGSLAAFVAFAFPPLAQSVRYGRVDVFALLWLFAALAALRVPRRSRSLGLALAGACSAAAVMSWAPAVLDLPLVAWALLRREKTPSDGVRSLAVAALSGVCALALLLMPFWGDLPARLARSVGTAVALESGTSTTLQWTSFLRELIVGAGFGLMPLAGFGCLLLVRKARLADGLLAASALAVAALFLVERCYVFRVVYLLPYLLVAVSALARHAVTKRLAWIALALALLSYVRTTGLWTLSACASRERCHHEDVREKCRATLGHDARVYLDALELYYVARDLGWHPYRYTLPSDNAPIGVLLDNVDWYVARERHVSPARADELHRHGFAEVAAIEPEPPRSPLAQRAARRGHTLAYGPYAVWRRQRR